MNDQNAGTTELPPSRSRFDKWFKIVFAAILVFAGIGVWWVFQRSSTASLKGDWGGDLEGALRKAGTERRKVVVLFTRKPAGETDEAVINKTLNAQLGVLEREKYILVHLNLRDNADQARRYDVQNGPTLVLLDADGNVVRKYAGWINEYQLCKDFLKVPMFADGETSTRPD